MDVIVVPRFCPDFRQKKVSEIGNGTQVSCLKSIHIQYVVRISDIHCIIIRRLTFKMKNSTYPFIKRSSLLNIFRVMSFTNRMEHKSYF